MDTSRYSPFARGNSEDVAARMARVRIVRPTPPPPLKRVSIWRKGSAYVNGAEMVVDMNERHDLSPEEFGVRFADRHPGTMVVFEGAW